MSCIIMKEHICMMNMPPRVKYRDTIFLYRLWKDRMAIRAMSMAAQRIPDER